MRNSKELNVNIEFLKNKNVVLELYLLPFEMEKLMIFLMTLCQFSS